jgi:hypothetical protein
MLSAYINRRTLLAVDRKVRRVSPPKIMILLFAVLALVGASWQKAYSDSTKDGLYSGTVPSSVVNLAWHTERERSSKNIADIAGTFSSYFESNANGIDTKRDFVVFLSGSYAIENGHLTDRLLAWVPEDFRYLISSIEIENKDCSILPLYFRDNQKIIIAVANLLREDDEVERICFLYGVRSALNLPIYAVNQYSSQELLLKTVSEVGK